MTLDPKLLLNIKLGPLPHYCEAYRVAYDAIKVLLKLEILVYHDAKNGHFNKEIQEEVLKEHLIGIKQWINVLNHMQNAEPVICRDNPPYNPNEEIPF